VLHVPAHLILLDFIIQQKKDTKVNSRLKVTSDVNKKAIINYFILLLFPAVQLPNLG
jgi:hypothetical protein